MSDRWLRVILVFVAIVLALWLIDVSIARNIRPVNGTVVMFDTTADDSAVWYSVTVDLDDGGVVHATNPMKMTTGVGSRVELAERTGWFTGARRYRLQRVLADAGGDRADRIRHQRRVRLLE